MWLFFTEAGWCTCKDTSTLYQWLEVTTRVGAMRQCVIVLHRSGVPGVLVKTLQRSNQRDLRFF